MLTKVFDCALLASSLAPQTPLRTGKQPLQSVSALYSFQQLHADLKLISLVHPWLFGRYVVEII